MWDDRTKDIKTEPQMEETSGCSFFLVETTADGVVVQTVFLTQHSKVIKMPAIFPTQEYALSQIDELRKVVIAHFTQAAQVGAKVISQTRGGSKPAAQISDLAPSPKDTLQ